MNPFLINAAPVLREMSHNEDAENLLKNQIWLFLGGKNKDEKLTFLEKGEVVIEKDENSETFKWEFTPSTSKLQVDNSEGFTFSILFIDKSVVVLQEISEKPEFAYLMNEKLLKRNEVDTYVHNAVAKYLNISLMHVTDGFDMEIHRRHAEDTIGTKGQQVTKDLKPLPDGMYKSSSSSFIYEVQDSVIVRKNLFFKISLSNGSSAGLYTENKTAYISAGDKILVNEQPLEDGKYFADDMWFVYESGKVNQSGLVKKYKSVKGLVIVEQNEAKPSSGNLAYLENGTAFDGEISTGLFKKIKVLGGKIV